MKFKSSTVLVLPLFLLASCAGKKDGAAGDSVNTVTSSISGQFIDAPVVGLNYSSSSFSGVTGANGSFNCALGEEVVFKLGTNIEIGKASCGKKVFLDSLDSRANRNKIGAVLQSFGIAGGVITIPEVVRLDPLLAINLASIDQVTDDANVASFISSINSRHALTKVAITTLAAESHLNDSLEENISFSTTLKSALDEIAWSKTSDVPGGTDTERFNINEDVFIEKNKDTNCEINFYMSLYKKMIGSVETYNVFAYTAPNTPINGVNGERVTGDVFSSKFDVTLSSIGYEGNFSAYLDIPNKRVKGKMNYTVSGMGPDPIKCTATINEIVKTDD